MPDAYVEHGRGFRYEGQSVSGSFSCSWVSMMSHHGEGIFLIWALDFHTCDWTADVKSGLYQECKNRDIFSPRYSLKVKLLTCLKVIIQ